jgi:hypothetical protein
MSDHPESKAVPQPARSKTKVSPLRNLAALILLAVFSTAAVLEFTAYRGHASAVKTLQAMIPKSTDGTPNEDPYTNVPGRPTQDQVEKAIGLSQPAKLSTEGPEKSATYNWKGVFRLHRLKAVYTTDSPPRLIRVETL